MSDPTCAGKQRTTVAPTDWHSNQGVTAQKSNGKKGVPGLRVMHVFVPWGRTFYAAGVERKRQEAPVRHFWCGRGFIKGRRWEEAPDSPALHGLAMWADGPLLQFEP